MPGYYEGAYNIYGPKQTDVRKEANKAPLSVIDSVDQLIAKYKGVPDAVLAGIQAAIFGAVTVASALSMIPFESNFASSFAGGVLRDLASPGVHTAINAPINDYLENLFPVREMAARQLVTAVEHAALSDDEVVDSLVDGGVKDKEIKKLVKLARILRFEKATRDDYAMLDRYQDALISAQLQIARLDVDEEIALRQDQIKAIKAWQREQAVAVTAP